MRWRAADADAYLQSADYIDTAVIPLISITSSGGLKEAVEQGESTQLLSEELERQLKGRVYLFPSYTYVDIDQSQIALLQKTQRRSDDQLSARLVPDGRRKMEGF